MQVPYGNDMEASMTVRDILYIHMAVPAIPYRMQVYILRYKSYDMMMFIATIFVMCLSCISDTEVRAISDMEADCYNACQ